jgi:hypothetical protein
MPTTPSMPTVPSMTIEQSNFQGAFLAFTASTGILRAAMKFSHF